MKVVLNTITLILTLIPEYKCNNSKTFKGIQRTQKISSLLAIAPMAPMYVYTVQNYMHYSWMRKYRLPFIESDRGAF
jgi:hypothetical protein